MRCPRFGQGGFAEGVSAVLGPAVNGNCSDEEIAVFLPACSRVCAGATGKCLGFGLSEHR